LGICQEGFSNFFENFSIPLRFKIYGSRPLYFASRPLDNYYYTLFSLKKQDGKITKSKNKKNNFFVHFAGRPGQKGWY